MSHILKELAEAPGAPGSESAVRALFHKHLAPCGTLTHDHLGSALCTRSGTGPRIMLTAHMDEVAFAVQSITKGGFIKIVALGGWWTHNLLAHRVLIHTRSGKSILGVIASTPPHFLSDNQRDKVLPIDQLFIDVGASTRDEATHSFGISLGDPITPDSSYTPLANPDLILCKAFDNRVGCGVMLETMLALQEISLPNSLISVGTVQEEIGCRGAITAAQLVQPDVALILEGTPADDTPGMDKSEAQGAIGSGPQLRLLDPTALMSRPLVDLVEKVAKDNAIPYQIAVRRSGGTDAKSIHIAHTGVPCIVIGVPARYIHSHNSMISLSDYTATISLLTAVIQKLDAATVSTLTQFS